MSAVVEHPAWVDEVLARWEQVLADPSLRDLQFKIETNRSGQIVMSPAKNIHANYQAELAALLKAALGGAVWTECGVVTPEGVKVADVAWDTQAFKARYGSDSAFVRAPAICVEIKSPSNTRGELSAKISLYLDAGAKEVWVVGSDGRVSFYDRTGQIATSSFPVDVSQLGAV